MPAADRQRRLSLELAFTAFSRDTRTMQKWVIDRLASLFDDRRVRAGEVIYRRGDPADTLFFMNKGTVRVMAEGSPTWAFEGRWVLGSAEVLLERPRSRTAVAVTDVDLVTIPADGWLALIEDSFDLARMIVQNTARGLTVFYGVLGDASFLEPATAPSLPLPTGPLDLVEKLLILSEVDILTEADVQSLTDLASSAEEVSFAPGDVILPRGAVRERLFVIADGLAEASREEPAVRGRFGPGSVVAGAAAFGDASTPWRAVALTPVRALSIPIELLLDELEEHFDVVRAAMMAMANERERLFDALMEKDPTAIFH